MIRTSTPARAAVAALIATAFSFSAAAAGSLHGERHVRAYRVKASVNLAHYADAHAVALGASGAIAGDAELNGSRRCLLASGGVLVDITPAGATECSVTAMSPNGTVAGRLGSGTKTQGFIYRAGRGYVIGDVASFSAVNSASLLLAVKQDGSHGVYDAQNGTWPVFADAGRGCAIDEPLALNDHYVFGTVKCSDGSANYGFADSGHFERISLPPGLLPTSILTGADQLVLSDPVSGGHAYLFSLRGSHQAVDLGEALGDLYGTYTPVAANAQGVVVGQNLPQFFPWVRSPSDGMRDLGAIIPVTYFGVSVAGLDEAGDVLVQAFDFNTGDQVWVVLQPV